MADKHIVLAVSLCFLFAAAVRGADEELECNMLEPNECAFAVDSTGSRCILEKFKAKNGNVVYDCQKSPVKSTEGVEYVETDHCKFACGVEGVTVGMSTDQLMNTYFVRRLCTDACRSSCPNLNDLYTTLAAEEGKDLQKICSFHNSRIFSTLTRGRENMEIAMSPY